jgi:DNA-binding response OmpR family regulator
MGGAELGRSALATDARLLVLYISGYTEEEMQQVGVERTRERFLAKPFTAHELLTTLDDLTATREGSVH